MQEEERSTQRMELEVATVTRVEAVGMGDRVCVDLCANMSPGEGMLVGNFCRTLFLVHSEVRLLALPSLFPPHFFQTYRTLATVCLNRSSIYGSIYGNIRLATIYCIHRVCVHQEHRTWPVQFDRLACWTCGPLVSRGTTLQCLELVRCLEPVLVSLCEKVFSANDAPVKPIDPRH